MSHLLAKSKPRETLIDHTMNCLSVYQSLYEAMPFLPEIAREEAFFEHLFYAVALHDFGKAATGFQAQLRQGTRWNYRHEILSAGFVVGLRLSEQARQGIGLAIMTHHKDIRILAERYPAYPPRNPGFSEWQRKLEELEPNWEELLFIQRQVIEWAPDGNTRFEPLPTVELLVNAYRDFLIPYRDDLEDQFLRPLHRQYGMLLRGCLIACDHLASAGKSRVLHTLEAIGQRMQREIERKGRVFQGWTTFQRSAGEVHSHLMLSAPTGAGKTEAALLWSEANRDPSGGRRVFYVLPYVASINAMYQRLRRLVGEKLLGVLHGKAHYFLYHHLADRSDDAGPAQVRETQNLSQKLYRPYKVLTPFQLLKAFFGLRGFEMQFAEMSDGLFIMDEIHAYDPHTTALILTMVERLRQEYGARFCIMTATMPQFLKTQFLGILPGVEALELSPDQRDQYTRHRVRLVPGGIMDVIPTIEERLLAGERVLVVCNTVRQAQQVFEALRGISSNAGLLHGRFMLGDRERMEARLEEYDLLVGTQAVEVSLDMDFDVLFTEPAPIDALIQRFGRVNRALRFPTVDVYICMEGSEHDAYIYPIERVACTLEELAHVDVLRESLIQNLIDAIYGEGYNRKEQKLFDNARELFSRYQSNVVPFVEDDSGREDFTGLFKSVEVVPSDYETCFLEHIASREFFEAMAYVASVSERQFMRLHREGQMYRQERQWFCRCGYDPERGLLLDELGGNVL